MEATPIMDHTTTDHPPFDPGCKYVRVTGTNPRGFVEFELSIGGAPELLVELTLPPAAFDAFCREQRVTRLNDEANP
ncbi:phenol hydroxylase [Burkholderia pseudomultivorans]|uniref:Phenol hydroxylase n=3 Tax=Burkholderia pseudomultivorans TaxID=1207504 RepID=A0A132F2H8_9BURK|nr:phenol hydroxylase [Burkholderia pseudomultivorans]KWF67725.1 phenol hydroxylase [Burkholderia pseudomultivorans]MBF5008410.1 phenol hydroxylase [Burkholderia pseudomultivorans]